MQIFRIFTVFYKIPVTKPITQPYQKYCFFTFKRLFHKKWWFWFEIQDLLFKLKYKFFRYFTLYRKIPVHYRFIHKILVNLSWDSSDSTYTCNFNESFNFTKVPIFKISYRFFIKYRRVWSENPLKDKFIS